MTPTGFQLRIRQLAPDDWAEYREIRLAALTESPEAFGSTLARSQQYTEQVWRSHLTTAVTFAAERENDRRLIGIASGLPTATEGAAMLIGMWVSPDARRQGVGEALVRRVIAWAEEQGYRHLELDVTVGNDRAERLYEQCGFTRTGGKDSGNGERQHSTVTMEREVGRGT
jgi:RimJ/RimL family protein N-acetyltransferase